MPDSAPSAFAYAIVRVVPRVERGERINVGVVLYSRQHDFLGALVALDEVRLAALAPDVSPGEVRSHLEAIVRVAAGDAEAGPIAALPQSERFGWLVAPSSTIIQTSEVHTGLCGDPAQVLERLFAKLVEPVTRS
jgi:Protein of unknown function (DUF3037)